jgi:hypothetical protein
MPAINQGTFMNRINLLSNRALAVCLAAGFYVPAVWAYPPAPHHLIYGVVRDEAGNCIDVDQAEVVLVTDAGTRITAPILQGLEPGLNFKLPIPMDSGITGDLYRPTALHPTVPFRLQVRIGQILYLPIEMKGDYARIGAPGERTRVDLTLGEDSDGDGLPDAWERALLAGLKSNQTLAGINPEGDADGDGLNNLNEYLAGTYAFDNHDGFALKIASHSGQTVRLEFMAIRGRTYWVQGSSDLVTWTKAEFLVVGDSADSPPVDSYYATDTRILAVDVAGSGEQKPMTAFRLMLE